MKKLKFTNTIAYCLVVLLISCKQSRTNSTGDTTTEETKITPDSKKKDQNEVKTEEEIILNIREKFRDINENSNSYKKVIKNLTEESSEGADLEGYYGNDELKKVVASYFGSIGKLIEEYYFFDNELFFVFTQEYHYTKPMDMEGSSVDTIEENRYYLEDSRLVRWLNPSHKKIVHSKFEQKEIELSKKVQKLRNILGVVSKDSKNQEGDNRVRQTSVEHDKRKDSSATFGMLQGKWQHITDKTNFLVFEGNHRKEVAGKEVSEWDDELFILSNKCLNESDSDSGIAPENQRYISCLESDLCWYIVEIDEQKLVLSYMARGNTLSYRRVLIRP